MKKGFTLVELLVVVAILGILAAVGIVSFGGFLGSAKENVAKANYNYVIKYIYTELDKCHLGVEKIMNDHVTCPHVTNATTFGPGIYAYIKESLVRADDIIRNPYNNKFAIGSFSTVGEVNILGYVSMQNVRTAGGHYIKVKTCFKSPCSDLNNNLDTLIMSDMISGGLD